MRFLIGLICGTGLIFAAFGVLGTGGGLDGRLPVWLDDVALRVGDWLSLPPRPDGAADDRVERLPASELASGEPDGSVAAAVATAGAGEAAVARNAPPAASVPIPRPPDPRTVDDVADDTAEAPPAEERPVARSGSRDEDVQALVAEIFAPRDGAGNPGTPVTAAPPVPAPPTPAAEAPAHGPDAAGGSRSQTVWVPFHSQMSAAGFAARLSESLGHPFDVERRGPGRYQVVFAYADEAERASLLEEAAAVTGLPL